MVCKKIAKQKEKIRVHCQQYKIPTDNLDEYGDKLLLGEWWEWKKPHQVEF